MKVSYRVTLDPLREESRVQLHLADLTPGETTLMTPAWVPGDYDFEKFGRNAFDLFDVLAADPASGKQLGLHRHGWSCYTVEQRGEALTVTYRAPAANMRSNEGGGRGSMLLGARYLRVAAHDGPCLVQYDVPEGWAVHHPAGARALGENTWEYESYEQLLETPVVLGRLEVAALQEDYL
jgi:predicted metalloprotease with PDZ domain